MDGAKIRLSEEEKMLVTDSHWILTKNGVLKKANVLLTQVMEVQSAWIAGHTGLLPQLLEHSSPKISRGDNYHGLPWLMLDQPRLFTHTDTAAIRCFFLWGHYFSITLQLEGTMNDLLKPAISKAFRLLAAKGYQLAISGQRWDHQVNNESFRALSAMDEPSFVAHADTHPFLKLVLTIPLDDWESAAARLSDESLFLLNFLLTPASGETDMIPRP